MILLLWRMRLAEEIVACRWGAPGVQSNRWSNQTRLCWRQNKRRARTKGIATAARMLFVHKQASPTEITSNRVKVKLVIKDAAGVAVERLAGLLCRQLVRLVPDNKFDLNIAGEVFKSRGPLFKTGDDGLRFSFPHCLITAAVGKYRFGEAVGAYGRRIISVPLIRLANNNSSTR